MRGEERAARSKKDESARKAVLVDRRFGRRLNRGPVAAGSMTPMAVDIAAFSWLAWL